jgi:hypothetical protein
MAAMAAAAISTNPAMADTQRTQLNRPDFSCGPLDIPSPPDVWTRRCISVARRLNSAPKKILVENREAVLSVASHTA